MNNFFCSVGSNLSAKTDNRQNEFIKYMSKQIPSSMVCETVIRFEIITLVCAFKDNKSLGPDNIGSKLLKSVLRYLIDPLLYICNLSFTTGCVPNSLKVAKVIPICKKVMQLSQVTIDRYLC